MTLYETANIRPHKINYLFLRHLSVKTLWGCGFYLFNFLFQGASKHVYNTPVYMPANTQIR